jgi:hypothetical protein
VEHRPRHRDLAVDPREEVRRRAHGLSHRQRVLQQASGVSLVVVLRGRGLPESRPDLGLRTEEALQQHPQRAVLDGCDQLAQVRLEQLDGTRRPLRQLLGVVLAGAGGPDRRQLDLPAELRVDREAPADQDDAAGCAELEALGDRVPRDGGDGPRLVRQDDPEVVLAVSLLATLALPHDEGA